MIEAYVEVDGQRIDLNQSRVQDYLNCHRLFYWRWVENIDVDRPRWALEIGTAWHSALAHLGSGCNVDEAVKLARQEMEKDLPKRMLPGDEEEFATAKDIVETLTRGYVAHWESEAGIWKPVAQEISGRVEVGEGTGVYLVFRTDRLVIWNNRLWILDAKSMGRLDLRDFMKYEMDLQFTAYIYGINKHFQTTHPGLRVAGIICDAGVKTKIPQFRREMYFRSEDELREFEREWVEVSKEILWRMRRVKEGDDAKTVFYKRTAHCFAYSTCVYRELCLRDTPTRRAIFVKRKEDYVDAFTRAPGQDDRVTGQPTSAGGADNPPGPSEASRENGNDLASLPKLNLG